MGLACAHRAGEDPADLHSVTFTVRRTRPSTSVRSARRCRPRRTRVRLRPHPRPCGPRSKIAATRGIRHGPTTKLILNLRRRKYPSIQTTHVAATRYHRARCTGWRPLSQGGNASRVVRRGLPCCPAQATAVRGSPTLRRSPTTSTPRNHVRPPRGAGTTGMARSAMMALWVPGLGGDLVITDPTSSRLLRFSARHTPAHREFSNTLSRPGHRFPRRGAVDIAIGQPIQPIGTDRAAAVGLQRAARDAVLRRGTRRRITPPDRPFPGDIEHARRAAMSSPNRRGSSPNHRLA